MTDAELLELLRRRSPDQLSLLELDRLQRQLLESESFREEALAGPQMRENVAEALSRLDISLDSILAQVPQHSRRRSQGLRRAAAVAIAALLALGAAAAWWSPWSERSLARQADASSAKAASTEKSTSEKDREDRAEDHDPDIASPADRAAKTNEERDASSDADSSERSRAASSDPAPKSPSRDDPETAPAPVPQPPRPVASGPWDAVLRPEAPAADIQNVAFRPFHTAKSTPSKEDLAEWLQPMNAHASIGERRTTAGNCGAINGLLRFLPPWRENAAVRFALEDYDRLKIHFFHGEQGVTLAFYQSQNFAWAAYHATRQPGSPQPDRYVLAATDSGRNMRTESRHGGPYQLQYRQGELILSRGDVPLLAAPLAAPPQDVFFDGAASFLGLEMVKLDGGEAAVEVEPVEATTWRPAELAWKESLAEGVVLKKQPDGAVELSAESAKQRGFVAAPIPGEGLREVILHISAASPGVGVFLGRGEEGKPHEVVKFLRDQRTGRLCLAMHGDDDAHERQFESVDERIVPFVPEPAWVRLLFGCGTLRVWLSGDGVHWSEPFYDPRTNLPGDVSHVGLHVAANLPDCRVRVESIQTRRLPAFHALADEELFKRASAFPQAADYGHWLAQTAAAEPPDADPLAWRRACAIRMLAAGCPLALGDALVNSLLDDAAERLSVEQQLRLLEEAALLLDLRSDHNRLMQFVARYHRLGEAAYRQGERRPFSLVRRAMMTAPIATLHHYRLGGEELIRAELIELLAGEQWRDVLGFCEMLRFYRLDENAPLAAFARSQAQRQSPEAAGSDALVEQRDAWRHPLVEELSKEAYNFLAEFQALLDSEAFDDAARMIASVEPHSAPGVAADRRDPRLLVSLPAAMRLALRDWPELRTVMEQDYADLAELRVRRAVSQGDEAAVRSAALQFDATPGAALAAQWLGDRALSLGRFEQALSFYDRAERTAGPTLTVELAPRKRLAAAMLGRDVGSPVTFPVELGDARISPEEFEAIVAQMRQRAESSPETFIHGASTAPRRQEAPAPVGFEANVRARFEGPAGDKPNELPRQVRQENVDWVARQLGWVVEGDTLYVSNRFHVAAYDLSNGKRRWQSPAPPGRGARSHDWSLAPMRPLATEKHILARQLNADGPLLACLDKQNGQVVWTSQPPQGEWLASDPLAVHGRLVAFRLRRDHAREMALLLCDYDSATGEPLDQQEVLRLRETPWTSRHVCQAAVVNDAVVAVLGGCTICVDLTGGVRWVRRGLYLPPDEDSAWGGQHHEPPLVDGGRIFVVQPGVPSVECIEADTGRSRWTRVTPHVRRVVGLAADRLIVELSNGFAALDPGTGEVLWRHETDARLLEGRLCGGAGGLLYVREARAGGDDNTPRPELVWLDPQTGETTAFALLESLQRNELQFGPMISHNDRLWAFAGAGPHDPHRDVVELVPQGDAAKPQRLADDAWLHHFNHDIQQAAARVLPDWTVTRGVAEKQSGLVAERHGERDVLAIDGTQGQPVLLSRRLTVPSGAPRLRIRLAMEELREGSLQVEFRGEPVWEQRLDGQSLGSRAWRDFEANLSSRAGRTGWLTVRLVPDQNQRYTSYWKRLEVAF